MKRLVLASLLTLAVTAPALAERASTRPAPITTYNQPVRHEKFDDEVVEGGVSGPDGTKVGGRIPKKFPSFINHRADFLPEMIKSSQDL